MSTSPTISAAPLPPKWMRFEAKKYGRDPNQPVTFTLKGEKHWQSNVGPQTWGLYCPFDEILVGGRRGGGKTAFLIAWAAMGDLSLPLDDPARYSFLNDKDYVALLLREEYQSMVDFIEEAVEFFKAFGGKPAGDPKYIKFASGARIYFNHLNNEESFTKYKGWNLTRIGIEELSNVATFKRYIKLVGSLRSVPRIRVINGQKKKFPGLRTQVVSTTNPDGVGGPWVRDRFVYVPGPGGEFIPWNTPMVDTFTKKVRIFIPFEIDNNPYLSEQTAEGQQYRGWLMSQDAVTRKQWMDGDWMAGSSTYFTEYRPKGPITDEERTKYPWARHIIKPVELKPWWYRWGSGDWGFDHPATFHKSCRNEQDNRIHIYDELQVRNMDSFELGAILAKWWYSDLIALQAAGQDPCVVVSLGSDAFSKDDATKTKAQRMEAGIKEVLGPLGALLLKYNEEEHDVMMKDPKRAQMLFERRKQSLQGSICIALKPCYIPKRVDAWDYVRSLIRFRPAVSGDMFTEEGRSKFLAGVLAQQGREAYEHKAIELRSLKPEVLPKVQIWDRCVELDRCLIAAQRDTRNDDDPSKVSHREDVKKRNADAEGLNGDDALECLIAGTKVLTEHGQRNIEDIQVGDFVHTRVGLRKVLAAGLVSKSKPTITVNFSDGQRLTGTFNHLVHTKKNGFMQLESLRNGDTIDTWQKPSFLVELSSEDTQNQSVGTYGITIGPAAIIGKGASGHSIKKFGARPMAKSLMGSISTTGTRMCSTMRSLISNASMALTTCGSTGQPWPTNSGASSLSGASHRSSGITPKRLVCLPRETTPLAWEKSKPKSINANNAASCLCPSTSSQGFATSTARLNGEGLTRYTILRSLARFVAFLSGLINTARSSVAPVYVVGKCVAETTAVYDLSIEGQPEYYANGILVHNSFRNVCVAFKDIETMMPKSYFVSDQMARMQEQHVENFGTELTDPTRLAMIAQTQAAKYDKQAGNQTKSFNFPRPGSMRHRLQ